MSTLTAEQKEFLQQGTRTGKLATVRKDGRPHVVPIWFVLDGDTLIFNTGDTTVKAANMRRDARVTLCVDDEIHPLALLSSRALPHWRQIVKISSYGPRVLVAATWEAIRRNSLVSAIVLPANLWCGSLRRR